MKLIVSFQLIILHSQVSVIANRKLSQAKTEILYSTPDDIEFKDSDAIEFPLATLNTKCDEKRWWPVRSLLEIVHKENDLPSKSPHVLKKRQAISSVDVTPNQTEEPMVWITRESNKSQKNGKILRNNGIVDRVITFKILKVTQILMMVFASVSIIAAILSVIVFSDKRMTNRVTLLVVAFNISELMKAFCLNVHRGWRVYLGNSPITWTSSYSDFFVYFVIWFPDTMGRISLLLNLIITIDRFVVLAFPLQNINRRVITHPKLAILLVSLSMILFQSSSLILYLTHVIHKGNNSMQFQSNEIISQIFRISPYSKKVYEITQVIASICFKYIPLVVTICLNIMTIISLMYHDRMKARTNTLNRSITSGTPSKFQPKKRQNNLLIVGSTLVFSFLVIAKPIVRAVSMLHPTFGHGKDDVYLYLLANEFSLLLDTISPLATFLTYCKLSSVFRMRLYYLFAQGGGR